MHFQSGYIHVHTSGVTSRAANPVPPVVSMRLNPSSSLHLFNISCHNIRHIKQIHRKRMKESTVATCICSTLSGTQALSTSSSPIPNLQCQCITRPYYNMLCMRAFTWTSDREVPSTEAHSCLQCLLWTACH